MAAFKVCPYVGVSLYNWHVPSGFNCRAEFDVKTSQVFPQAVVAEVTLVGSEAGAGGARARARGEEGLLSAPRPSDHQQPWP